MDRKKDALVPVEKTEEEQEVVTPVEEEYRHARSYFRESGAQALRTNAALLTVIGLFVVRAVRLAWEAVSRTVFRRRRKGKDA
jgi:hypothetical protein